MNKLTSRLLILAIALLFTNCQSAKEPTIDIEIAELVTQTTSNGAALVTPPDVQHIKGTVRASWEFQTEWGWEEYIDWVKTELDTMYTFSDTTERRALFRKITVGDSYRLEISILSDDPLTLRANFTAVPY